MGPHLLLAIALAIGLSGCGGKPKSEQGGSESSSGFQYGAFGAHKTMGDARAERREKEQATDAGKDD